MSEPNPEPFGREESLDKPGIIGARWWQRSLEAGDAAVTRRKAVKAMLIGGGAILGVGLLVAAASGSSSSDYRYEPRPALDMQREYGWSFGANGEALTFNGESTQPFDREALSHLASDVMPAFSGHYFIHVATLFESVTATPRTTPHDDTTQPAPLKSVLKPIFTSAMDVAYRRGRALAALFRGKTKGVMLLVDLPGPEAVAFAAGASQVFDPVFGFDNWPHPRGVVAAHETLAAAAYYQPLFAKRVQGTYPPMIVLDRRRLAPYSDDASQFDNRHLARVPDVSALKRMSVTRVLYVAPDGTTDQELDDLNDDLVLYARAGVDVRLVGASAFGPDASASSPPSPSSPADDRPAYYYGASAASNEWFWHEYPWATPEPGAVAPRRAYGGPEWSPKPRLTPFSTGAPSTGATRRQPSNFGTVAVVISVATGLLLGARLFRSGSWNRSSSGGSSWGG